MTDDCTTSSFHDSRSSPTDVRIALMDTSSMEKDLRNENTSISASNQTNNLDRVSDKERKPGNYYESSNQPVVRTSSKRSNIFGKLFVISKLETLPFYQALLSEYIGTMLLTLICTSTGLPITSKSVPDLHGALASGFVVATIIVGFGHISGAHINPAVTVTFLTVSEIDVFGALCYICVQLLGASSACILLKFLAPFQAQGNLGTTMITEGISVGHACIVEFIITFILCYTVHAVSDKRRDDVNGSKALAIGLSVTVGCLFAGPYTGASMNPARSFGPAAIMGLWKNHWVYWFGPMTGAVVAALIYTRVLKKPPPTDIHNELHVR